jgi:hypothetical protein
MSKRSGISSISQACDKLMGIHNYIWACQSCNSSKSNKGLYAFYKQRLPDEKKFFDYLPDLLEKKYLKTMYCCHVCAGTLESVDLDGDGQVSVLDIDAVIDKYCMKR